MFLQWIIFLVIFLQKSSPQCLLTSSSGQCSFCSYSSYSSDQSQYLSPNPQFSSSSCIPQENTSIRRNVLIIDPSKAPSNIATSSFDQTYSSIEDAFGNETLNAIPHYFSEMTFYFSMGTHYMIPPASSNGLSFFRRVNASLSFQSLQCSFVSIDGICCAANDRPTIIVKTMRVYFSVGNRLEIRNLNFDAIDTNYWGTNTSCVQNGEVCCIGDTLENSASTNSSCYLNASFVTTSSMPIGELYGLFNLEAIYDDPNHEVPVLLMYNVSFTNFYVLSSNNPLFLSLISVDYFGGTLLIENITISNSFFEASIILYSDINSLQKNIYNTSAIFLSSENQNKLSQIININGWTLSNINLLGQESHGSNVWGFHAIILALNFQGTFNVNSTIISIVTLFANTPFLTLTSCLSVVFNSISLINLQNPIIFSISQCGLTIISNLQINQVVLISQSILISSSQVNFQSFFLSNSSGSASNPLISASDGLCTIQNSGINTYTELNMNFVNCTVNFINTTFNILKSSNSVNMFSLKNCDVLIINSQFQQITGFNAILSFVASTSIQFINSKFNTLSGNYIVSGTDVQTLLVSGSTFSNISNFAYIFNKATKFIQAYFSSSTFKYITLKSALIYSVTQLNLSVVSCSFSYINLTSSKTSSFMCVQIGQELIQNSSFSEIRFLIAGTALINFKVSNVVVKDSNFHNMGWAYLVNLSALTSLEYVNLFMVWTCDTVLFRNNSFSNKGSLSLFSGFIYATLTVSSIVIEYNSFNVQDKQPNYYYMGMISGGAPDITLSNNRFQGVQCANFPSFLENNGPVSLQGASTYAFLANQFTASVVNNIILNTNCEAAGAIGILNYDYLVVEGLYTLNTSALEGGAVLIAGSTSMQMSKVFINSSSAVAAHSMSIKNMINVQISEFTILECFSQTMGGIAITSFTTFTVNLGLVFDGQTIDNGAVFKIYAGHNTIANSTFIECQSENSGAIAFLTNQGNFSGFNLTGINLTSQMGGIYIDSAILLVMKSCNFSYAFSQMQGAALFVNLIENVSISDFAISESQSLTSGIIYLKDNQQDAVYYIEKLTCINNKANSGSCIFSEGQGSLAIVNFLVIGNVNNVFSISSLFFLSANLSEGNFVNCTTNSDLIFFNSFNLTISEVNFTFNTINIALIRTEESFYAIFEHCQFWGSMNNNHLVSIPAILILNTNSTIFKISFIQNELQPIFLLSSESSNILFSNITISEQTHNGPALITLEKGMIIIVNSGFYQSQGIILTAIDANISITNSVFNKNLGDSIYNIADIKVSSQFSQNLAVDVINTTFLVESTLSSYFSGVLTVNIKNSTYQGNQTSQAIQIMNSFNIFLQNSSFSNFNNSLQAAAAVLINFQNPRLFSNVKIDNCSFKSNLACFSSVFYINGLYNISLTNSIFLSNKALQHSKPSPKCGIAGVAYLFCTMGMGCSYLIENNYFEENFADQLVPTIFSKSSVQVKNNSFANNSDGLGFTTNMTSFPLTIEMDVANASGNFIISSGSSFPLPFLLLDAFNQPFFSSQSETALLVKATDSTSDLVVVNTMSLATIKGIFNFSSLTITKFPETNFTLELRLSIYDEIIGFADSFSQDFSFYSRSCLVGEVLTIENQCQICAQSLFSLIDPMQNQNIHKCSYCLPNAYCPGGAFLVPLAGYWRADFNSTYIVQCVLMAACTGPPALSISDYFSNYSGNLMNISFISGQCYLGHEGNLCFKCINGYGKTSSQSTCSPCGNIQSTSYLKLISTLIFLAIYSFFNAKAFMDLKNEDDKQDVMGVTSKIVVNHMQKMAIVSYISITGFGADLSSFINVINVLSFVNEDNISSECVMRQFFTNSDNFYIYKVFFSFILPIIESFLCLLLLIIIRIVMQFKGQKSGTKFKRLYLVFLICCYLCYPLVTKCSLSMINCIRIDETQNTYLYLSPNIQCWVGLHKTVFFAIGFLGILVWGLLFPIFLAYIIGKSLKKKRTKSITRNSIRNDKNEKSVHEIVLREKMSMDSSDDQNGNIASRDQDPESIIASSQLIKPTTGNKPVNKSVFGPDRKPKENNYSFDENNKKETPKHATSRKVKMAGLYQFFYKDYKEKFYYWESIIFLQKFFLSLLPNMTELMGSSIDLVFVIIMLIYSWPLIIFSPFAIYSLNKLETLSIAVTIVSRVLNILSTYYSENLSFASFCSVITILINAIFFLCAAYLIYKHTDWKEFMGKYQQKYHKAKRAMKNVGAFIHKMSRIGSKFSSPRKLNSGRGSILGFQKENEPKGNQYSQKGSIFGSQKENEPKEIQNSGRGNILGFQNRNVANGKQEVSQQVQMEKNSAGIENL